MSAAGVDLIVGIRGGFKSRSPITPTEVGGLLPYTLNQWGLVSPWEACDSDADLESTEPDALRAWNHVALEPAHTGQLDDLPVSGLLRTTWDSIELFGTVGLTGVDVIVPTSHARSRMHERVAASAVRDADRQSPKAPRCLMQASRAWPTSPRIKWDSGAIANTLNGLVDVLVVTEDLSTVSFPDSRIPSPFALSDDRPFRAEVLLRDWTIDDAAWVAEAMAVCCHEAGIDQDVQIAVRISHS